MCYKYTFRRIFIFLALVHVTLRSGVLLILHISIIKDCSNKLIQTCNNIKLPTFSRCQLCIEEHTRTFCQSNKSRLYIVPHEKKHTLCFGGIVRSICQFQPGTRQKIKSSVIRIASYTNITCTLQFIVRQALKQHPVYSILGNVFVYHMSTYCIITYQYSTMCQLNV